MNTQNTFKKDYLNGPQGSYLFKLNSAQDNTLRIVALSIHLTYRLSPMIKGFPNEEINEQTLQEIRNHIKQADNLETPIYYAPFENIQLKKENDEIINRLPLLYYVAEIESDGTDEEHMFSSLLYVAFHDSIPFGEIEGILEKDLKNLEWDKYSKSWNP